jgi:hypothetical protein
MLRTLIRHRRSQAVIASTMAGALSLVGRTTRWTLVGAEHAEAALRGPDGGMIGSAVVAFWHEQLGLMPLAWRQARVALDVLSHSEMHVLVSRHRDGRLIGDVAGRFDLSMVHASSSRGGAEGLRALGRVLAGGQMVAITPDGPRGPRRRAAPGVALLAALSGRPVLPLGAATSRMWGLSSWDRMLLPLPFARGILVIGPPIPIARKGAEAALPAIEAALSEASERAAQLVVGHSAPPPCR